MQKVKGSEDFLKPMYISDLNMRLCYEIINVICLNCE